jgi:hypothetical protein
MVSTLHGISELYIVTRFHSGDEIFPQIKFNCFGKTETIWHLHIHNKLEFKYGTVRQVRQGHTWLA